METEIVGMAGSGVNQITVARSENRATIFLENDAEIVSALTRDETIRLAGLLLESVGLGHLPQKGILRFREEDMRDYHKRKPECRGHADGHADGPTMGETFYCDGSCRER